MTLNYFISNHGNNACDAAAHHAKQRLNEYQRNQNVGLYSNEEIAKTITTLNNHSATTTPKRLDDICTISTFNGIRKLSKFMVTKDFEDPDKIYINAFELSEQNFRTTKFCPEKSELMNLKKLILETLAKNHE